MSEKNLYVLKNEQKKSVFTTEYWSHREREESFVIEEMFRWGETFLMLNDEERDEILSLIEDEEEIEVVGFQIEDQNLMDGCSMYFNSDSDLLVEEVETLWDNEGYMGLDEAGWDCDDSITIYSGPCTLELCEIEK